jgi:DNA-binding transcriptional MocR family regulator
MPVDSVERLKILYAAGVIESVSSYVAQAVHDRLDRQTWLERWLARVGNPYREATAWADEVIDRHFGTAARPAS